MQSFQRKPHLTTAKIPLVQTSLRSQSPKIKRFQELEKGKPEKAPNFKARALNKKV